MTLIGISTCRARTNAAPHRQQTPTTAPTQIKESRS